MRRRTKKNVRKHGPARPVFDDEREWGQPSDDEAPEPPVEAEDAAAETPTAVLAAERDPLDEFLDTYTPPPRKKSRVMVVAVAVSAVLHISTVTIFSIVIYFPREDIQYYDFRFVPVGQATLAEGPGDTFRPSAGDGLRLGGGFESVLGEDSVVDQFPTRPAVQLPTLERATLDRLRLRQATMEDRASYDRLFGAGPQDSWARFGQSITRVRDALAGTEGSPLQTTASPAPGLDSGAEVTVVRPADGFEAIVSWDSPENRRQLLFSPPIQSLYDATGAVLARGIEVVFEINATGRVVNVWSSTVDETGIVDDIQATILQYRFEPVREGQRDQASGVIRIRRSEPAP